MSDPMIRPDSYLAIVDQVVRVFDEEKQQQEFRDAFITTLGDATVEVSRSRFMQALGDVVQLSLCGFVLGHLDHEQFEEQHSSILWACVKLKTGYEVPPRLGSDIDADLVVFDEWLRDNNRHNRQVLCDTTHAGSSASLATKRPRLLRLHTFADYCFVLVVPNDEIETLRTMLAAEGITSERVVSDTEEQERLWYVPSTKALDVAKQHLVDRHGFEVIESIDRERRRSCALRRWVDEDNGLRIDIRESTNTSIDFGFVRRDIAELFAQLIPETYHETLLTVRDRDYLGTPDRLWGAYEEANEVLAFFDEWVPQYVATTTLEHMTGLMEAEVHRVLFSAADSWNRAMNRMLNGWDAKRYGSFADDESFADTGDIAERFEAWIAEHPNGKR